MFTTVSFVNLDLVT